MLTAAGVSAPDGNELLAFQTGLWGAFLQELYRRQPGGLENAWVSFFTYEPKVGAAIFADWVQALPNLQWIAGKRLKAVLRDRDRIVGAQWDDLTVYANITIDGTELGDVLALGQVPYRWGWEDQTVFAEPSAPASLTDPTDPLSSLVQTYPVQAPTWVVVLQDAGEGNRTPTIAPALPYRPELFDGAWDDYGPATFLTYGRLPQQQIMLNWPHRGNDYGVGLDRLVNGDAAWRAWADEAIAHSQNFAAFIQAELSPRYGLANGAFPRLPGGLGGGAFALHPYYRESRRLVGITTVTEWDILPLPGGRVAALPVNQQGTMSGIAIGNYPNDHHYPGYTLPLASKSFRWGGRWTGTAFSIPLEALIPVAVDGLLVCDKNISVSHIANGATRLQPVVLGVGQAAGMAAALCIEQRCQPRDLPVDAVQTALLNDPEAPAAIVPLLNVLPGTATWQASQRRYQQYPERYPSSGDIDIAQPRQLTLATRSAHHSAAGLLCFQGIFKCIKKGSIWQSQLHITETCRVDLVTLDPLIHEHLQELDDDQPVSLIGVANWAGNWIQVIEITR